MTEQRNIAIFSTLLSQSTVTDGTISLFQSATHDSPIDALCAIYCAHIAHHHCEQLIEIAKQSEKFNSFIASTIIVEINNPSTIGLYILNYSISQKYEQLICRILEKEAVEITESIYIEIVKCELFAIAENVINKKYPLCSELKEKLQYDIASDISISVAIKVCIDAKIDDLIISKLIQHFKAKLDSAVVEVLLVAKKEKIALDILHNKQLYSDNLLAVGISTLNHRFCLYFIKMYENTISSASVICSAIIDQLKKKMPYLEFYLYIWRKVESKTELESDKELIEFIEQQIQRTELQFIYNNPNPIKIGILLSELFAIIESNKKSIKIKAKALKEEAISITARMQEAIEDEQELSLLYNDCDIENRPVISIVQSDIYLLLCENKNFEKIVNDLWNGPYNTEGGGLVKSTSSLLRLFSNGFLSRKDDEREIRCNVSKIDIKKLPLHSYQFVTWATGFQYKYLFTLLMEFAFFFIIFIVSYLCLTEIREGLNLQARIESIQANMYATGDFSSASNLSEMWHSVLVHFDNASHSAYYSCLLMSLRTVLIFHYIWLAIYMILCKKSIWNALSHSASEFIVCVYCVIISMFLLPRFKSLLSLDDLVARILALGDTINQTHFEVFMALSLIVLILKLLFNLRSNRVIGPFLKILFMVEQNISSLLLVYLSLLLVFSTAIYVLEYGNEHEEFRSVYRICLIMFMATVNGFNYSLFANSLAGNVMYTVYIVTNSIVLMNMIIGTIGTIYEKMSKKSNNLSTIEILKLQSIYTYSTEFSSLVALPPMINSLTGLIQMLIIACTPTSKRSKVNLVVLFMQYTLMFIPVIVIYMLTEFFLAIIIYPLKIIHKFILVFVGVGNKKGKRCTLFLEWIFLGPAFVIYYIFVDIGNFSRHCYSRKFVQNNAPVEANFIDKKILLRFCGELKSMQEHSSVEKTVEQVKTMGIVATSIKRDTTPKSPKKGCNNKIAPERKESNIRQLLGKIEVEDFENNDEAAQSMSNYIILCKLILNNKDRVGYNEYEVNTANLYKILMCHYETEDLKKCSEHLRNKSKRAMNKTSSSIHTTSFSFVYKKSKDFEEEKKEFLKNSINMKLMCIYVLKQYVLSSIEWDYDQNKCRYLDESTQMHQKVGLAALKLYDQLFAKKGLCALDSKQDSQIDEEYTSAKKSILKEKLS